MRLRSFSSVLGATLLFASFGVGAVRNPVAAESLPARPPDGTYSYSLVAGGATLGTFTDVIDGTASGTVAVTESASVPVQQIAIRSMVRYDARTLHETSYSADVTLPAGKQHTELTVTPAGMHVVATPGGMADIAPVAGTQLELSADNFAGSFVLIPAIVHATGVTSFTLAALAGARAIAAHVVADPAPARPAAAAAGDANLAIEAAGIREIFWYDPATFVVHDIDIPVQHVEFQLTHTTAALAAPAARALAVALPTPVPHFTSTDVHFTSADGTVLAGSLTVPDRGKPPFAAIVLVHGSGRTDRNETIGPNAVFLQLSNALSNDGYVVLRYDKRGVGGSGGAQTSGTRDQLLADVEAAFAFASAQSDVDPKRVYLLGHSEGGELVPTVATRQAKVAGIILMAPPALPLWRVSMEQTLASVPAAQRKDMEAQELAALQNMRTSTALADAWYRSSMDVDPAVDIARVRVPILILQGEADVQVLPADLPRLVAAARATNRDVTVDTFSDLNHLFEPVPPGVAQTPQAAVTQYLTVPARIDDRVLDALAGWLRAHAGA
jgi:alpha-beta hydrolase superfamily lysophospholipase